MTAFILPSGSRVIADSIVTPPDIPSKIAVEARAEVLPLKAVYVAPKPKIVPIAPQMQYSGSLPAILLKIRHCESQDNYTAQNSHSTASGAFQIVDGTWGGYGGFAKAKYAPPAVQDAKAILIYNASGTAPWNSSRGCWG